MRNPGVPMTYQVSECVGEAHMRAMTSANITEGFKRSGIFPHNAHIFEESDLLTLSVTYRPQETASLAAAALNRIFLCLNLHHPIFS
jgi:hypothetical protein